MPALKHILHEKFALAYPALASKGLGLGEIYAAIGGQASSKRTQQVMGSRIFGRPDVQERITELAKGAAAKAGRDAEHYLGRLDQVFTGSIEDREYGHAARATELGAKISGVLVDRSEIRTSIAFDELRTVDQAAKAMLADGDVDAALAGIEALRDAVIKLASSRAKVIGAELMIPTSGKEQSNQPAAVEVERLG